MEDLTYIIYLLTKIVTPLAVSVTVLNMWKKLSAYENVMFCVFKNVPVIEILKYIEMLFDQTQHAASSVSGCL